MSDPVELTGPEQRAILIMARWADEAGLRRCRWSLPNDASWPHSHLAGLPVRHDGLPDQYDLLARAPWRPERVVCSLHRSADGYEVTGVPGEEWLRRAPGSPPPPVRPRPRVRLPAAAAGLLVPVGALGGLAVATTVGQQDQPPPPAAIAPTRVEPAPAPPLPADAEEWATAARVRLAAMSQQLETLTAAEAVWTALPPERRTGEPPSQVRKLQSTLTELSQRRAALAAELDALDALHEARADLTTTEERLAEVRSALALGDTTASGQLREQAERLARQATEQRGRLSSWQRSVDSAIDAPLPAPVEAAPTADAVIALAEEDPPPATDQEAPVVAAGREVETGAAEVPDDDAEPDPDRDPDGDEPGRDRDEPGTGSGNHADRDHIGVPNVAKDVVEDDVLEDDVLEDKAPVDSELPHAVPGLDATAPSEDAPEPDPEPDSDIAEPGEIDASTAEAPQDGQPEAAPDAPTESRSAITPAEREQINKKIDSWIGGAVDSHADEFTAAADRMEDMTLNDLLRQDGETDQELRERLTKAAQDYQTQAGSGQ